MMLTVRPGKQRGFSLIELLVVMVVIGILAALLMSNLVGARERARDARRKADLDEMKKALRFYYNDFETYPENDAQNRIVGCGPGGVNATVCDWEDPFALDNETVYMKFLPLGPGDQEYVYTQTDGGDGFTLMTELENAGDQDAAKSQGRCGTGTGKEYVVCED